jgi:hypothetical protein
MEKTSFYKMLKNPMPFTACYEHRRQQWSLMHSWSQSPEAIRSLQALAHSQGTRCAQIKSLPVCPPDIELDTRQIANTVKNIMKAKCISYIKLARKVAYISIDRVKSLLRDPTPWHECLQYKKQIFLSMHRWSQSSEAVNALACTRSSHPRRQVYESNFRKLPEVPAGVELDTAHQVQSLVSVLRTKNISKYAFARQVLSMSSSKSIQRLFKNPIQWSRCNEYQKKLHLRIHQWLQQLNSTNSPDIVEN